MPILSYVTIFNIALLVIEEVLKKHYHKLAVFLAASFILVLAASYYIYPHFFNGGQLSNVGNKIAKVVVYKDETCTCCQKWVSYLNDNGISATVVSVKDMQSIKSKHKVPSNVVSCHTALMNEYILEGHIPIEVIKKLLHDKPRVKGIAVPGMPIGSPGMPGNSYTSFKVYSFDANQAVREYATVSISNPFTYKYKLQFKGE